MADEREPQGTGENDPAGTPKPGGLGTEGTIPDEPGGVAAGHTGELSTFEPEEDEAVDAASADEQDAPNPPDQPVDDRP